MPTQPIDLDTTDLKILAALQRDASLTNVELARRAVGLGVSVFISISRREQNTAALAVFERHIEACDEVMECYLMAGDADYLLRVVVPDIRALERLVLDRLSPIPGVEKIRSSFTLK